MIRAGVVLVPVLHAGAAAAQDGNGAAWQGRYRYEAGAGRTVGGTGIVVTYDLTLGPPGGRGGCVLAARGFQTDERILCEAKGDARTLTVAFHRYAEGGVTNKYGVAVYRPGEALFTLAKGDDGLTTRWRALRPDRERTPEAGRFFEAVPKR